jgi:hypothetical protein
MVDQGFLPPALQQIAAPAATNSPDGPASMLGGMLPGHSSVMSGIDRMMGLGRGPVPTDLAGGPAPAGAAAITNPVMAAGPVEDIGKGLGQFWDDTKKGGGEIISGIKDWFKEPPLKVPIDWSLVPPLIPDPIAPPPPAPVQPAPAPAPAPAPKKPMSGPQPEMPWYLEPAGPSTW